MPEKPIPKIGPPSMRAPTRKERQYEAMNPWFDPNTQILGRANTVLNLLPSWLQPDPLDVNPAGKAIDATAFGLNAKALKGLKYKVLEQMEDNISDKSIADLLIDKASKYKSLGMIGHFRGWEPGGDLGEYTPISGPINKLLSSPKDAPFSPLNYRPDYTAEELTDLLYSSEPDKVQEALDALRYGQYGNAYGMSVKTSRSPEEVLETFYHEMTHMGQDLAKGGLLRNSFTNYQIYPYRHRPQEIAANAGARRRLDRDINEEAKRELIGKKMTEQDYLDTRFAPYSLTESWAANTPSQSLPAIFTQLNRHLNRAGSNKALIPDLDRSAPNMLTPFSVGSFNSPEWAEFLKKRAATNAIPFKVW